VLCLLSSPPYSLFVTPFSQLFLASIDILGNADHIQDSGKLSDRIIIKITPILRGYLMTIIDENRGYLAGINYTTADIFCSKKAAKTLSAI
jgi:hypothetical protein